MALLRISCALFLLALSALGLAQSWSRAYEEGLTAARGGNWKLARSAFQQAVVYRPEDASLATVLPGPPTERRRWRDGAPYSPNFLAAYSLMKEGLGMSVDARVNPLRSAAAEFGLLLDKGQASRETYFFLDRIHEQLADDTARKKLAERAQSDIGRINWKVDTEVLQPEDVAALKARGRNPLTPATDAEIVLAGSTPVVPGRVAIEPTKYALVIGNSEGKAGLTLPYAVEDARRLRESLITDAGYAESNITLLTNATSDAILGAAKALSEKVPNQATVLIYFAGVGTNLGGSDYLSGVDAASETASTGMVGKGEIFRLFLAKGARLFAFFEANRAMREGRYFGGEIPTAGSVAQIQATLPGESVTSHTVGGRTTGIFTSAMVEVLGELKSNRIPILEFGWQVFYKIRRGGTGTTGGGSRQTPTLPVLTNMASDARF